MNPNVALDKPAFQKTTYKDGAVEGNAGLAVDGVLYNDDGSDKEYSHTQSGEQQWWVVDLEREFLISTLRIFARTNNRKLIYWWV